MRRKLDGKAAAKAPAAVAKAKNAAKPAKTPPPKPPKDSPPAAVTKPRTSARRPKAPPAGRSATPRGPAVTVQPIHFGDYDGHQFERLLYAYLYRTRTWTTLEWHGQAGSDDGRDILGVTAGATPITVLAQAANREKLAFEKVRADLTAAIEHEGRAPHTFIVVSGHRVSAKLRDRIRAHAQALGVQVCETWSGTEFEERLRADAEPLLRRFVDGLVFPEAADDLKHFADASAGLGAPIGTTVASGPASMAAGRDLVTNNFSGPVYINDGRKEYGDASDDTGDVIEEELLETRSLASLLYARTPDGASRSAHFWRVGVFGDAFQLSSIETKTEEEFRDLIRRTFPENAGAELGDPSSTAIHVEHLVEGTSRVWMRASGVVGMTAALDESSVGSYRVQDVAVLIARFLRMIPAIAGQGSVTVQLEFNPADRTLLESGAVQGIRRPRCQQTEEWHREDVGELRDLGQVAPQVAARLLTPLLREFHLVRVDSARFGNEVAGLLAAPQDSPSSVRVPAAMPTPDGTSIHTINRDDAVRVLGTLSALDIAFLRMIAEDTLAGRVMAAMGGTATHVGPLLGPGQGLATAGAMLARLQRTIDGLRSDRVSEVERRLRSEDLIAAQFAPPENYDEAGRPSRADRASAFSRITPLGLRVILARETARVTGRATEMAFALVEASLDLDRALHGLYSLHLDIIRRLREPGYHPSETSFTGELYSRLQFIDATTAQEVDRIRETRDALLWGKATEGLSATLVRTARAIAESLTTRQPRLALIAAPKDRAVYGHGLELVIANYGPVAADGPTITFEVPGGFGINRGPEKGGGWFQTPTISAPRLDQIGKAGAYDHRPVGELRRLDGHRVLGSVLKWRITGGGAPVDGELRFDPDRFTR